VAVFSITNEFAESVALINLLGLDNLVIVNLRGNENIIDSDKRIRIPLLSPLAKPVIKPDATANVVTDTFSDQIFDALVSGTYKNLGEELFVHNNPDINNIYLRVGDFIYMRIKNELINPAPIVHHVSSNGFNLYKIAKKDTLTLNVNGDYQIFTLSTDPNMG
jgi:hypothetical protein